MKEAQDPDTTFERYEKWLDHYNNIEFEVLDYEQKLRFQNLMNARV
ncbi:MAG: hypothetical protein R3A12_13655 [Ignavibacteria bacterium]